MAFRWAQKKIPIPRPSFQVAWGILILWGFSLLFVECGAQLRPTTVIPVVKDLESCKPDRAPTEAEIVTQLNEEDLLTVREQVGHGAYSCYRVEFRGGLEGWVPWDVRYLRSEGYTLRFRPWLSEGAEGSN